MRQGLVCFSDSGGKKKKMPPANAELQLLARSCPPQLGALFSGAARQPVNGLALGDGSLDSWPGSLGPVDSAEPPGSALRRTRGVAALPERASGRLRLGPR